jgi:hypothetical protein
MKLLFDQNLSFKLCVRLADVFPGSEQARHLGFAEAEDRARFGSTPGTMASFLSRKIRTSPTWPHFTARHPKSFGCVAETSRLKRLSDCCALTPWQSPRFSGTTRLFASKSSDRNDSRRQRQDWANGTGRTGPRPSSPIQHHRPTSSPAWDERRNLKIRSIESDFDHFSSPTRLSGTGMLMAARTDRANSRLLLRLWTVPATFHFCTHIFAWQSAGKNTTLHP